MVANDWCKNDNKCCIKLEYHPFVISRYLSHLLSKFTYKVHDFSVNRNQQVQQLLCYLISFSPTYNHQKIITQILLENTNKMSRVMRKPDFRLGENKTDQLRSNGEADQRLYFRYFDSTISLLPSPKFQASSHLL